MMLVSLSIIAASVERFPNAWRYFARPYKSPDESFRTRSAIAGTIAIPMKSRDWWRAERALQKWD